VQTFAGNPRGWRLSTGDPVADRAFRRRCEEANIPAYVHAPYLVNFDGVSNAATTTSDRDRNGLPRLGIQPRSLRRNGPV
jgi:deoxyribonuclease-4